MTFPGPDVLGRGLVVPAGAPVPPPFATAGRVVIDDAVLADPTATADELHRAWAQRRRVVVELAVPAEVVRDPESCLLAPHLLDPGFTFQRERLQFLLWANNYDARRPGPPTWWHGVRAMKLGARLTPDGPGDVLLPDGNPACCDGGPRRPVHLHPDLGGLAVVHRDSIDAGLLTVARHASPSADLAPDQLAAVGHPGGPARIIAPAGSGKTRVLTERIRHLLCDRGYEPSLVTAVAYNVLAAEQLRERTEGFRPTIRTLNSLGLSVCQLEPGRRWQVATEREQRELLGGLVPARRKVNTDPLAPYLDALSAVRLGLCPPERAERFYPDAAGLTDIFPAYREHLDARGLLDFDEQIYRAIGLLLADPDLRAEVRSGARTLLVDEFQDLTPAHLLLVRLVAGPAADVFGVGDDDQVIYGYAGADPGFLIDYAGYFPGADAYDLEVNYRCPEPVVTAAGHLLSHNARRLPKLIRPAEEGRRHDSGDALTVRLAPPEELGPVTVDVVERWRKDGVDSSDIAVLTRVNSSLLAVQVLLTEAGIPCRGAVGPWLLERAGTAAALAYLRIAANPRSISRADVRATVRRPSRKISPKAVEMLTKDAVTSLRSIRGLAGWLEDKPAFQRDVERVHGYADDLEGLVAAARAPGATTAGLLRQVRDEIGLGEAMDTLDASKGTLDRSANGDDLAALLQVAALHPDPSTFEAWLRSVLDTSSGSSPEGVHLATVHRVKGREWPCVAVFGADAGLFPHRLAGDEEEERRIFHVAVTRARDRVAILGDAAAPSPFLAELTRPAPESPAGAGPDATPVAKSRDQGSGATRIRDVPEEAGATVAAAVGLELTTGAAQGRVVEVGRGAAVVDTAAGSIAVDFGTPVSVDGRTVRLAPPPARVEAARTALTAWRTARAKTEGKPAYVYLTNATIAAVAERDPDTPARLARCAGIGPAKLEAYGETILALLDEIEPEGEE